VDKSIVSQKFFGKKEQGPINSTNLYSLRFISLLVVIFLLFLVSSSKTIAANQIEMRGQVTYLNAERFVWNSANFAGFYYDIDKDISSEQLIFKLSKSKRYPTSAMLSDQPEGNDSRGIVYKTQARPMNFSFKPWGKYWIMGFIGEKYFAAYDDKSYLRSQSNNSSNLMEYGQICRILIDSNAEETISSTSSLKLDEGYELAIKSIDADGNKVHVDLLKDGQIIDSKIVKPSMPNAKMKDKTYFFKTNLEDTEDAITIAVHFRNAFQSGDTSIATVDGVFQISETPTSIIEGQQFDRMSIKEFDYNQLNITMDNKDYQIRLIKNNDILLMRGIYIKTANQDAIDSSYPLRYYIYKKYTEPGIYEIRGSVANLGQNFSYNHATFPGFYYDIDNDIGAEQITFYPKKTTAMLSDQLDSIDSYGKSVRGVVYTTKAQNKSFAFKEWGQYKVIGFLGEKYFAAYDGFKTPKMKDEKISFPYDKSSNNNLMTFEQLTNILIDSNDEITVTSDEPLLLEEGYELAIKSIDEKGNKVNVELSKDGEVVDNKVVQPSIDEATMADKTYYYGKAGLGDSKEIVIIAVHFKDAISGSGDSSAIIDGIFQISETPTHLKANQQYGKMSIRNVNSTALSILMDNKDHPITLTRNKNILLMENTYNKIAEEANKTAIYIKTADQDDISYPLRYYIYTNETIEE
jgi:S-layer protein (TIGR01567 family)